MTESDVIVIGAGPVGLTLAGELSRVGSTAQVFEQRSTFTDRPKATLLGSRSMEYFRRWGISDQIYEASLPNDHPYYIVFATSIEGFELFRVQSPSIRESIERSQHTLKKFRELNWSPYSKTQIGQQALEPVLSRYVVASSNVELNYGQEVVEYTQDSRGVSVCVRDVESGMETIHRGKYLVGCEGSSSFVRRAIGSRYNGRGRMRRNVSFFFRAKEFLARNSKGIANLYFVFNPPIFGVFTAIDAEELWNFQYYFLDDPDDPSKVDPSEILFTAFGSSFEFELLHTEHWYHNQSVATTWRNDRVFIAGDAAHLFVPTGGVGMNTGIGDAVDLAWKLNAVITGWGGETLLESFQAERKPIAIRNSIASANNSDKTDMVMNEIPDYINEDSPRGEDARRMAREQIAWLSHQFNSAGLHLGYRYKNSHVIVSDGTPEPPDDTAQLSPSTWPGMRFPHFWLGDSVSTLDLFGDGFVIICCGGGLASDIATLAAAIRERGGPCTSVEVELSVDEIGARFTLVRPDGHVAWRGDKPPPAADNVAETVMGHVHAFPTQEEER